MRLIRTLALMVAVTAMVVSSSPLRAADADSQIEASAKDLYVFKTYLQGDDVKIQSKDGVVTLTGTVANEPRRMLAQETVASLPGVTSVDNKLEIAGERPAENSDGWLAAKVTTTLLFHRNVSGRETQVSVKDGIVTLRGEAASLAEKQLTAEYAKDIDGVKDVENEMTVAKEPKQRSETVGEKIDDASITAQVKLALLFHRSTSPLRTQVQTTGGVVTVGGMAKNEAEKDLVSKLVADVRGVDTVVNKMTIEPVK